MELTITDDDLPEVSIALSSSDTITEGAAATFTITITDAPTMDMGLPVQILVGELPLTTWRKR